jgi:hypothetical protein
MTSINDFATTYMCQSLPFGGVKHSGFDRFAGIEGLRGMCIPKVRRWPRGCGLPRMQALEGSSHAAAGCFWEREGRALPALPCPLPPLLFAALPLVVVPPPARPPPPPPIEQAVAEDRWPFKTAIPPLLQYPVSDRAFDFVSSLVWMFYAPGWAGEGAAGCCCCSVKCRAVQCSTRAWRVNTRLVHAWGGARGVSCCGVQAT